jgi:hypothetical protein
MTPEQKLQILEDFLNSLAHVDDGNVQVLLKANVNAQAALDRINMKRWNLVVETTLDAQRLAEWVESVTDFKCLSITATESYT